MASNLRRFDPNDYGAPPVEEDQSSGQPRNNGLVPLSEYYGFEQPAAPPGERSLMGDIGRGFASSAVGTLAAGVGGAEYALGSGGTLTRWRESLSQTSRELAEGMSPQMQQALQREFIPGGEGESAWSSFGTFVGSAMAQVVATTGSLTAAVPAVLGAALAGPYAVPTAAIIAAGTGATLGAGTVWNEAAETFQGLSEEERRRNPTYARLREQGADVPSAIDQTVREAASGYVEFSAAASGAINAATGGFLGRLGGRNLGGFRRGAVEGFRTEAATETLEEGTQADLTQRVQGNLTGQEYSVRQTLEQAARGGIAGGALGAGMGGLGGIGTRPEETEQERAARIEAELFARQQGNVRGVEPAGRDPNQPALPAPPAPPGGQRADFTVNTAGEATPSVDPSISAALSPGQEVDPEFAEAGTLPAQGATPPPGATGASAGTNVRRPRQNAAPPAPTVDPSVSAAIDASQPPAPAAAQTAPPPAPPIAAASSVATEAAATTPPPPPVEAPPPAPEPPPAPLAPVAAQGAEAAAQGAKPTPAQKTAQAVAEAYVIAQQAIQEGLLPAAPTREQVKEVLGVSGQTGAILTARLRKDAGAEPATAAVAAEAVGAAQPDAQTENFSPNISETSAEVVSPRTGEQDSEASTESEPALLPTVEPEVPPAPKPAPKQSADEKRAQAPEQKDEKSEGALTKAERDEQEAIRRLAARTAVAKAEPKEAKPAPKAAPVSKGVRTAARANLRGPLTVQAGEIVGRVFGDSPGPTKADIADLVDTILADADKQIEADGKSVSEVTKELESRAVEALTLSLSDLAKRRRSEEAAEAATEAAADEKEDGTATGLEDRKRMSAAVATMALDGNPEAIRFTLARAMETAQRSLPRWVSGNFPEAMIVERGKGVPDWLARLRQIAESAKRGGGDKEKTARNEAITKLRESLSTASAENDTKAQQNAAKVIEAFREGGAENYATENDRARVKRYNALRTKVREALGSGSLKTQIAMVGSDPEAAAVLTFLARAGRNTDTNFSADVSQSFALSELLIRDGRGREALAMMRETADVTAGGLGTAGTESNEDGEATGGSLTDSMVDERAGPDAITDADMSSEAFAEQRAAAEAAFKSLAARNRRAIAAPRRPAQSAAPAVAEDPAATAEEIAALREAQAARWREKTGVPTTEQRKETQRTVSANTLTLGKARSAAGSTDGSITQEGAFILANTKPTAVSFATDASMAQALLDGTEGSLDRALYGVLAQKVGNVEIRHIPDAVWQKNAGRSKALFLPNDIASVKSGAPPGIILVPESLVKANDAALVRELLMHELVHAGTYATVLTANSKARAKLLKLMEIVRANQPKGLDARTKQRLEYSLTNPEEFIAVAMSSPELQRVLMQIAVTPEQRKALGLLGVVRQAFQGFVNWAREALGLPPGFYSVMESVIEIAGYAIQDSNAQRAQLAQFVNPRLADENTKAYAAMFSAIGGMGNVFSPSALGQGAQRSGTNIGAGLRKLGLGFATMRQIEMAARNLFSRDARMNLLYPGSSDTAVEVASKAHLERNIKARDSLTKFLQPLRAFEALPAAGQQKVSELLIDATTSEVHPDAPLGAGGANKHLVGTGPRQVQGRARHAELSRRYNGLSAAEKKAYQDTLKALSDAHTAAVESIVGYQIDLWFGQQVDRHLANPTKNPLPIQRSALADLKRRAMQDKLTDPEKDMLGEPVVETLERARNRAKMAGPYVPLQRFGDWVVSWTENAPEYVTFPDVAAANAFEQSTPYAVLERKTHYFDAAGKEITTPDPAILAAEEGVALSSLGTNPTPAERNKAMRAAAKAALKKTQAGAARSEVRVRQQVKGLAFFESLAEANEAREELRGQGRTVEEVRVRDNPQARASALQDADFERMKDSIKNDPNLPDSFKEQAIDSLAAAYVAVIPNRTLQASLIKRRKVIGATRDVRRVVANYGVAVSNFTAGMDSALPITMALKSVREQERDGSRSTGPDSGASVSRGMVREELETRLLNPPTEGAGGRGSEIPLLRKLQSMAYIFYLASPSYSMIQSTQPWMLTLPSLGARFGMAKGAKALGRAMKDIGLTDVLKGGVKDTVTAMKAYRTANGEPAPILTDLKNRLGKQRDGRELVAMIETLEREGLVDGEAGLELVRSELQRDSKFGRFLGNTEALARAFPAAIEVVNRTSSAIAAYRLAREKGMSAEAATAYAREVVDQTQADYSSGNTARFMDPRRYPWIAPMMTFRKYAQAVYALMIRNAYLAFKDADPEVRRVAGRTLLFTLGSHAMVAGALGLPTEILNVLMGVTALLFGSDEPWDWEKEVRQVLADAFGPEVGEVIARGLPRAAGIDLHGRMGLNSLLFIHDLRDFENRTMTEYAGQFLLGAPGAMVANMLAAPGQIASGNWERGVEAAVPKGIRDVLKTIRFADEGVTTRRGERIDGGQPGEPGLDTVEMIVQALGFTPARIAETYERRNAVQGANRQFTEQRNALIRDYRQGDPAERREVWQRIRDWNASLPPGSREARITRETLVRSVREAARRTRQSGGEDYLPRGREFLREEGRFANTGR